MGINTALARVKSIRIPFGWFCLAFFCLFYCIQNHNHRFTMSDFKVYYSAAQNLLSHKPIYSQAFGLSSGLYKYSPVALLAFVPFSVLPFFWAATLYFTLLAFFIFLTIKKIRSFAQSLDPQKTLSSSFPYLILLIGGAHFYRELHLGNINTILLFLAMVSFELLQRGKKIPSGILLGIIVLFKPHFAIVLPVLLIFELATPFVISIGTIIIGATVPIFYFGFQGNLRMHKEWLLTMVGHNTPEELIKAPNTLQHVVSLFVNNGFSGMNALTTLCAAAFMYGLIFVLKNSYPNRFVGGGRALPFFLCIAAIPNITFTDTEHFLLALPLVGAVLYLFSRQTTILKIIIVVAFALYGGNWHDVWGNALSNAIERAGILGIGNAMIIALALRDYP
jgi:hypothetical protein